MPTYEYCCTKCKKHFDVVQKITEPAKSKCPECGADAKRLISGSTFALKGGGWYKDGYGSSSTKPKSDKPKGS